MKIIPVILCGGSGTRLWPLSRENHPKQFVNLGHGRTLFKDTLLRLKAFPDIQEPIVICNEAHRFFAIKQLSEVSVSGRLILEPAPRNTAPAIALAAEILKEDPENLILVLPADHYIKDNGEFAKAIQSATRLALKDKIVVFGIKPHEAATGYGYIRADEKVDSAYKISQFVEKPDHKTAAEMLAKGIYYWNAGIFLMKPELYLRELEKFSSEIAIACNKAMANSSMDNNCIRPDEDLFLKTPDDSIDYAVMEKTKESMMIPLNVKWSDLGSWEAFFQRDDKDADNNVIHGDVLVKDTNNCYLHSGGRLLTTIGVSNLMVVETKDAVVVATRQEGQKIKEIVASLKKSGRYHYKQHPLVYKPWGSYEILSVGDRFQVKRLIVNPEESLSLQYHHHRAEHWIIVSGTAEISLNGEKQLYTENQSVYIPIGCKHMVNNPGRIPLTLIEVQSGSYLEEDDIVRESDKYGRDKKT